LDYDRGRDWIGTVAQSAIGSVLIPLTLLVILELASVARDIDLLELLKQDPKPIIGLPLSPLVDIPPLGRFNLIHALNTVILFYLEYFVLTGIGPSSPRTSIDIALTSVIIIWLVWVVLPLLEVEEYDSILRYTERPRSLYLHAITATGAVVLVSIWGSPYSHPDLVEGAAISFLVLNILSFLMTLGDELATALKP